MDVPTLVGDRARLRPWSHDDATWYVESRDELVLVWTTESASTTAEEVRTAIAETAAADDVAAFAICDAADRLVGNVAAVLDGRCADVSYFLAPDGRGRGLASDAVGLVVDWLVGSGRVDLVSATVAVGNEASQAVLRRCGFREMGEAMHPTLGASTRWEWSAAAQA